MTKTEYLLREIRTKLWIKPSLTGIAAIIWVSLAYAFADELPEKLWIEVKRDILLNLLGILASTMLTVATFSVSAMVGAYSAVATTATPRATRIVMEDRSSQNALTSFLSAFIYAIVALVALSILEYGSAGRLLLFTGFAIMISWVLVSFIRWVDQVTKLGRMGDTLERVEAASHEAFSSPDCMGTLGARPCADDSTLDHTITSETTGYIQNIDVGELERLAAGHDCRIRIHLRPGAFVDAGDVLASTSLKLESEQLAGIRGAFQTGDARRITSDPRFSLILLAEIADRALSPAVNDPGTAIAVLGIQVRLIGRWACHMKEKAEIKYPHIEVHELVADDLLEDAFLPICRDGASMFEVGARLQKSFAALVKLGDPGIAEAARGQSRLALEQALEALPTEAQKTKIRQLADLVGCPAPDGHSHPGGAVSKG